jgi:methionyl-tRNA formyltransferase
VTRAVVFAYHDVGVRCLRTLLAHGVEVPLVVTHDDSPGETIWFDSVARHARWHDLEVITPADANAPGVLAVVQAARPDFLFSFYYRQMLGAPLLAVAARGAYNMHGSLLPKYRGRVPVNWAVLKGERETGATLHVMAAKPDAGAIVAQQAVPILPDDTAVEVFRKVTVAAEMALDRALPALLAGSAQLRQQDLSQGSYYGRRTAADGAIDWSAGCGAVHNLVRAVAPPYPGAHGRAGDLPLTLLRTLPAAAPRATRPVLQWRDGAVCALCHDGALRVLEFELDGAIRDPAAFRARFGEAPLPLG